MHIEFVQMAILPFVVKTGYISLKCKRLSLKDYDIKSEIRFRFSHSSQSIQNYISSVINVVELS